MGHEEGGVEGGEERDEHRSSGFIVDPPLAVCHLSTCGIRVGRGFPASKRSARGVSNVPCAHAPGGIELLIGLDTRANGAQPHWHILKDSQRPLHSDKRGWPTDEQHLNKLLQDIV